MGAGETVLLFQKVESHLIAVNAAIVAFLVMINFGFYRVHAERSRWEGFFFGCLTCGWMFNLGYLTLESLKTNVFGGPTGTVPADWEPQLVVPLNAFNTISSALVMLGGLGILQQPKRMRSFVGGLLLAAVVTGGLVNISPINPLVFWYYCVPGAVFDAVAWVIVAMGLRRIVLLDWKNKPVHTAIVLAPLWVYAFLQVGFLPWAPTWFDVKYTALLSMGTFLVALVCKAIHLVGLALFFTSRSQRLQRAMDQVQHQKRYISQMVHELKTPAAELQLELDQLERAGSGRIDAKRVVYEITGLATRLLAIVQGAYEEVRQSASVTTSTLEWRTADINTLLEASILSLKAVYKSKEITFRRQYSRSLKFLCRPDLLRRALDNILLNAYEALDRNGGIISIVSSRDKTGGIVVRIADNGTGFAPQYLGQVGQVRFSTKEGADRGHGLMVACQQVQAHKGTLSIKSPPPDFPRGTSIEIVLPVDSK